MNKKGFAKIYQDMSQHSLTINEAIKEIDSFLKTVEDALMVDGKVKFPERGTFEILERKPKIISNPITRELMKIYPKKKLKFIPSKKFNEKLEG